MSTATATAPETAPAAVAAAVAAATAAATAAADAAAAIAAAASSVPTETKIKPPKLMLPRDQALVHLQNQFRRGTEIKALRIRSGNELDRARATKLEWTNRTVELLLELFDTRVVADECNDWVGKIYPEYAEFGNFVEQFYAEMDHRLKRLKAVIRSIEREQPVVETTTATVAEVLNAATASESANGEAVDEASLVIHTPQAAPALAAAAKAAPAPAAAPVGELLSGLLVACNANEGIRQSVVEFFQSLDMEVAIVQDTSGMAEALDREAKVSFAVILSAGEVQDHNFELGYCAGRLGLKRVFLLHPHQQAEPDKRGLTHVALDVGGGWQLQLARQLKRAGLGVDLNRLC